MFCCSVFFFKGPGSTPFDLKNNAECVTVACGHGVGQKPVTCFLGDVLCFSSVGTFDSTLPEIMFTKAVQNTNPGGSVYYHSHALDFWRTRVGLLAF